MMVEVLGIYYVSDSMFLSAQETQTHPAARHYHSSRHSRHYCSENFLVISLVHHVFEFCINGQFPVYVEAYSIYCGENVDKQFRGSMWKENQCRARQQVVQK